MSTITAETILTLIEQLPPTEQAKLEQLIAQRHTPPQNGKKPLDKRVPPIPLPDQAAMQRWLGEHAHEYPGEWIALDGDKLIAHGTNRQEVWAAAQASGAYLTGVSLCLPIEEGLPRLFSSLGGMVEAFGHEVTLQAGEMAFQSIVYFAKYPNLPRNLLGRQGWLRNLKLAVIDYDNVLYLSAYNS